LDQHPVAREVAQIAACIGRDFDYPALSAISQVPRDKLEDGLSHLVKAELIFARGKPPEASYVFKHALVRDAAYETLLKSRLEAIHGRIALWLEDHIESGNMPAETIAVQFAAAHRQQVGGNACQLEAGRGCHHPGLGFRRRGQREVPRRLEDFETLSASSTAAAGELGCQRFSLDAKLSAGDFKPCRRDFIGTSQKSRPACLANALAL
jgi:hypothetical protein